MSAGPEIAFVDLDNGATYAVELLDGQPSRIARRLHFGEAADLKLTGSTARRVIKAWRDQVKAGGRGHV